MQWSRDLAYAVGLITTDGCLSKDGRHIDLTSKDLDQIQNFAKILKLTNKIGTKNNGSLTSKYYRIQFGDVKFYKFLLNIGLTPHKSKTLGNLKIPKTYFLDFLRGHFDGDGSLFTYEDKYNHYKGRKYINQRVYLYFISASKNHLEWLQKNITELTNLKGAVQISSSSGNHSTLYVLKFSKKEALQLISRIYYKPNLPSLIRKLLLAQMILEKSLAMKRKLYTRLSN